jgi:hypothetical protein
MLQGGNLRHIFRRPRAADGSRALKRATARVRSFGGRSPSGRRAVKLLAVAGLVTTATTVAAVAEITQNNTDQIIAVGPTSSAHGFPSWYRDAGFVDTATGAAYDSVDLEPCINPDDAFCLTEPLPDPDAPMSVATGNFHEEFFYSQASANVAAGGVNFDWEAALEGTWAQEEVAEGDQMVFGRIRMRAEGLAPGTEYTITHPSGTDKFVATTDDRNINYTQDIGAVAGAFSSAFASRVGPFLRWAPNPNDANDKPPAGYLGDPNVDHKIIGSKFNQNYVRITGTNVGAGRTAATTCPTDPNVPGYWDGSPNDCLITDQFAVMGKLSTAGDLEATRASYNRKADGATTLDIFGRSKGSQDIVVQDGDRTSDRRFAATTLTGSQGNYFAHVRATDLPSDVTVVNRTDEPDSVRVVKLRDVVNVKNAVYDVGAKTLKVTAESSDKKTGSEPTLKVAGYGDPAIGADGTVTIENVAVPPPSVKVVSSAGGADSEETDVAGGITAPITLAATATGPATAEQGAKVTLSAEGSTGTIDSYSWSGPSDITLDGAKTATPSFTVPALDPVTSTRDLTFTLTIKGVGGQSTANVTVKVNPIAPPAARIAPVATVERGATITLDGGGSTGAQSYEWEYVKGANDPAITLGATDGQKLSFTFPQTSNALTFRLTVTNPQGLSSTATIVLQAITDRLAVTASRYEGDKRRWTISGTATMLTSNQVTVHAGPTLAGTVIGRATVVPTGGTAGTWSVDVRNSNVPISAASCGNGTSCVSIESSRGGQLLRQAMQRVR